MSTSSDEDACDITTAIADLVEAFEAAKNKCGTTACEDLPAEDIPSEDLNDLCGGADYETLLDEVEAKCGAMVARTGAIPDISYPDPGPPPATGCDLEDWLTKKTDYINNLHCPQCPEYQSILPADYTTCFWPESFWTKMQIKWANKIEFWTEMRSGGGTGPWTWTKVVDYSPTYSGSWTNITLTYAWPKINDWNRWYWKIKNTNCCVETPIYHRRCTYPPPYVPPKPSYRLEYANYSEYSLDTTVDIISVPTGAYSNGTDIKYMHISWDTHTAPDQMILNWTAPGMGTLIDTGYVLGVYTYTVPMPQVSTVPPGGAAIDFVENGDSWHSGWEVAIVVNDSP